MSESYEPEWDLTTIPHKPFFSESQRRKRALQVNPPRPKVLSPCQHCGTQLGARERRAACVVCGGRQSKR